jgi:hypothetical protein
MYQIEEISNIISEAGLATLGTDMFLYSVDATATNCIILYPSNDPPIIDPDLPNYFRGKFQVIVRNYTHEGGLDISNAVSKALTLFNTDLDTIFIKYVRPMYQARVYRRSDSGLIEFSVTYDIRYIAK